MGCCAVAGNTGTCRTSQRDGSVATGFAKPMKSLPVTLGVATGNTSRHRGETCVRRASGDATDGESSAGKSTDQPGGLAFEPSSKSKRKRRDGKNTKRATITVEGVAIEAAKGNAVPTVASVSEEAYLLFLFGYVVIIFVGGLALAGSAFKVFPDVVENWVSGTYWAFPKSRHCLLPLPDCLLPPVECTTGSSYWRTRSSYKYITNALFARTVHPYIAQHGTDPFRSQSQERCIPPTRPL